MKTTDLTNKVKACLLGLLPIFTILPVFGQSQYQGTYLGYGYVRLAGAETQPETPSGIAIAEVAADGSISLQNGDINPLFPALRSGHQLFQRPSPQKQIPSNQ